jgi:hypothetical protein
MAPTAKAVGMEPPMSMTAFVVFPMSVSEPGTTICYPPSAVPDSRARTAQRHGVRAGRFFDPSLSKKL